MFQFPEKKTAEIVTEFCGRLRRSYRSVEGYLKQAKEYNRSRIQKQEEAKDAILLNDAEEAIKLGILSRNECLKTLSNIARGDTRTVGDNTVVPTDGDRIRAITQLSKMQGWEAPQKVAETDVQGNDIVKITPYEAAVFVQQLQINLRHE